MVKHPVPSAPDRKRSGHPAPLLGIFLSRDLREYADGMNLEAAYFIPDDVDPGGSKKGGKGDKRSGINTEATEHRTTKGGKGRTRRKHQKGGGHSSKAGHKARAKFKFHKGVLLWIAIDHLVDPPVADAAEIKFGWRAGRFWRGPRKCECVCHTYFYTEIIPAWWAVGKKTEVSGARKIMTQSHGIIGRAECAAKEGVDYYRLADRVIGYSIYESEFTLCTFGGVTDGPGPPDKDKCKESCD